MVNVWSAGGRTGVQYVTQSRLPYRSVSVFSLSLSCLHLDSVTSPWLNPSPVIFSVSFCFPNSSPGLAGRCLLCSGCDTSAINTRTPTLSGWLFHKFTSLMKQPTLFWIWPTLCEPAKRWISQSKGVLICCQHLFPLTVHTTVLGTKYKCLPPSWFHCISEMSHLNVLDHQTYFNISK